MSSLTSTVERLQSSGEPTRRFGDTDGGIRKILAAGLVTMVATGIAIVYLSPLAYMGATALKTEAMIQDFRAPLYPAAPGQVAYDGEELDLYEVSLPDGSTANLALLQPGRQASMYVDPDDLEAAPIEWEGNWRQLEPAYTFSPQTDNFSAAWEQMDFLVLLRNTVAIAGLGMIGTLIASTLVAYGLSRFQMPFKRTIFIVLVATIILPRFVTLVPTYALFFKIGWVGTWLPLIIPHFFGNAYNVFLLRQYFLTLPKDLDEAAAIDGAGPLRTLWSVLLPQARPALVAVGIFHFFYAWNDFFEPLVYLSTRRDLQPIAVGLQVFNTLFDTSPHLIQAGALLALAIPLVIFFFAQRVFLKGIDLSGVSK
ncbi:carbohydrate ABC transporter permease [Euzebya tangerina]|uniref:carbohydrate ABC transporter permease n=1 Tax=Euzebya tangerina TaxID=591198 RepID=UPI00196ABFAD|nr:carbohydrate ABC transporter permease [Euzebya tangerina]